MSRSTTCRGASSTGFPFTRRRQVVVSRKSSVVFDSASRATAGRFRFRFWIDDARPPTLRVLGIRGGDLVIQARDAGSGIDPESLVVRVDGSIVDPRLRDDRVLVSVRGLNRGRHQLVVRSSDYQETRNMEDVPRILPNTRELRASFTVR